VTDQRTALITGGTGSLGYQAAKAIAADSGWLVVITGRRPGEVSRAAAVLSAETGAEIVGMPLDLGVLADVRRFTGELVNRGLPPLHAIVCNAGMQTVSGMSVTADGFEQTFAVNHLAHFLLVRDLLPHLASQGRIVLVASDTHDPAKRTGMPAPAYTDARSLAHPDSPAPDSAALDGRRRYTTSKLCNVLMAYELARRLAAGSAEGPPAVTVNAFDPGLMPGTGLARDYPTVQGLAWRYLMPALTVLPGLNVHTPRRSGAALARLVTDPELAAVTGRYFSGAREIRSSVDSYDLGKAADLWETSADLVEAR
jgi:NAD(P)-dependent dehydrogenase (short-subunit alcohol dehydrogenase family)